MARCACGNATCSCIVKAVPKSGITVIGSGSPTRPYLIGMDESTAIGEVIDVVDTPTVNLEKSGTGTPADHFQLSASATVKMTDLLDVNDPTGPQLNEVPVWMGNHWEFRAQSGGGGGGGEAVADVLHRVVVGTYTVTGTSTATAQTVISVTIPNPVNGRRYRVTATLGVIPGVDGMYVRHQLGWGKNVTETTATWFAGGYTDHRIAGRNVWFSAVGEFVYTGATNDTGINVLLAMFPEPTKAAAPYGQQDRPAYLIVDEMITAGGSGTTQTPISTVHGSWEHRNPAVNSIPNSTVTVVNFEYVAVAPVGGLTMTAGTVKVPVAGSYLVSGAVAFNANATGSRYAYIYQNGVYKIRIAMDQNEGLPTVTFAKLLDCAANDTIDVRVYQASGAALTLLNSNSSCVLDVSLVDVPAGTGVAGINTEGYGITGDGSIANPIKPGPAYDLGAGIDLNTITKPGLYCQRLTANATSALNYPTPLVAGLLEVFTNGSNMTWQRYTGYPGAPSIAGALATWVRGLYGSTWQPWIQIGGDTGWVDIAIQAGYTSQGAEKPQVRMRNGVVYSRGGWSQTGMAINTTQKPIGTVPAGFRPTQNVIHRAGSVSGAAVAEIFIETDGIVSARIGATTTYVMLGATWLTD